MVAKVYSFAARESPQTRAAERKHPAVISVCAVASSHLLEGLRHLFASADDLLFGMAESAKHSEEKRSYLEAMRALRLDQIAVSQGFAKSLDAAFSKPPVERTNVPDDGNLTMKGNDEVEEFIAISNMEHKASSRYPEVVWDISNRLEQLSRDTKGEIHRDALSPKSLVLAFQDAMSGTEMEFQVRLSVYKLFERVVITDRLGAMYMDVLNDLAQHGIGPRPAAHFLNPNRGNMQSGPEQLVQQAARGAGGSSLGAGAAGAGSHGIAVPPDLYSFLAAFAARHPVATAPLFAQRQDDIALAAELFAILERLRHGAKVNSYLPAENILAVANAFETLTGDETIGEYGRSVLYRLLVPAFRSASADPLFFADSAHPMRNLIREAYILLAATNGDREKAMEAERVITALASSVQLRDVEFGRVAHVAAEELLQTYVREAERIVGERSMAKSTRSRAIAVQRVRQAVDLYDPPPEIVKSLVSGMGPVLAAAYQESGLDGGLWAEMCELLDGLCSAYTARAAELPSLVDRWEKLLLRSGMPAERVHQVISPFRTGLSRSRNPSVAEQFSIDDFEIPESLSLNSLPAPALSAILRPGAWFQIFDPADGARYFMKIASYSPAQQRVTFEDFGGKQCYASAANFARDIAAGRSFPVAPDEATQDAIRLLAEAGHGRRPSDQPLIWTKS